MDEFIHGIEDSIRDGRTENDIVKDKGKQHDPYHNDEVVRRIVKRFRSVLIEVPSSRSFYEKNHFNIKGGIEFGGRFPDILISEKDFKKYDPIIQAFADQVEPPIPELHEETSDDIDHDDELSETLQNMSLNPTGKNDRYSNPVEHQTKNKTINRYKIQVEKEEDIESVRAKDKRVVCQVVHFVNRLLLTNAFIRYKQSTPASPLEIDKEFRESTFDNWSDCVMSSIGYCKVGKDNPNPEGCAQRKGQKSYTNVTALSFLPGDCREHVSLTAFILAGISRKVSRWRSSYSFGIFHGSYFRNSSPQIPKQGPFSGGPYALKDHIENHSAIIWLNKDAKTARKIVRVIDSHSSFQCIQSRQTTCDSSCVFRAFIDPNSLKNRENFVFRAEHYSGKDVYIKLTPHTWHGAFLVSADEFPTKGTMYFHNRPAKWPSKLLMSLIAEDPETYTRHFLETLGCKIESKSLAFAKADRRSKQPKRSRSKRFTDLLSRKRESIGNLTRKKHQ